MTRSIDSHQDLAVTAHQTDNPGGHLVHTAGDANSTNPWIGPIPGAPNLTQYCVANCNIGFGVDGTTIYEFTGQFSTIAGALTYVSAANDGTVWGVNTSATGANVYQYNGNQGWTAMGTSFMTQVSVGSSGDVWAVNDQAPANTPNVYNWNGTGWTLMGNTVLTYVSVGIDGTVWGLDAGISNGTNVYQWDPATNTFISVSDLPMNLIAVGSASMVFAADSKNVYNYANDQWNVVGLPDTKKSLASLSVAYDGTLSAVDSNDILYIGLFGA